MQAERIREAVRRSISLRTPDKPEHGAYHVDTRSMQVRIGAIAKRVGKDAPILLVGDDDLTSVCLHRLGYHDITVVDFDDDLLEIVARASRGKVRVVRFDLRSVYSGKLPALGARYQLFVTDPPYGKDGLRVFSGVGVRALAPGGWALVVAPARRALNSSVRDPLELSRQLQTFLVTSGCTLVEILEEAQRSYHGTVSSLIVGRKTARRGRVKFDVLDGPDFFY